MDEEETVEETTEEVTEEPAAAPAADHSADIAELREELHGLSEMLEGIRDSIALFVSNGGATVREDAEEPDEKVISVADIPGVDDLDLTI